MWITVAELQKKGALPHQRGYGVGLRAPANGDATALSGVVEQAGNDRQCVFRLRQDLEHPDHTAGTGEIDVTSEQFAARGSHDMASHLAMALLAGRVTEQLIEC